MHDQNVQGEARIFEYVITSTPKDGCDAAIGACLDHT